MIIVNGDGHKWISLPIIRTFIMTPPSPLDLIATFLIIILLVRGFVMHTKTIYLSVRHFLVYFIGLPIIKYCNSWYFRQLHPCLIHHYNIKSKYQRICKCDYEVGTYIRKGIYAFSRSINPYKKSFWPGYDFLYLPIPLDFTMIIMYILKKFPCRINLIIFILRCVL